MLSLFLLQVVEFLNNIDIDDVKYPRVYKFHVVIVLFHVRQHFSNVGHKLPV